MMTAVSLPAFQPFAAPIDHIERACGHLYDVQTGHGIRWFPDRLERMAHGSCVERVRMATRSPRDCWHYLAYVDAFPSVTHWWFGSSWTQRVRATTMAVRDDGAIVVFVQPVLADADECTWVITDGRITGELPDPASAPRNVPLRWAMNRMVQQVAQRRIALNQWVAVTSLVAPTTLRLLLADPQRMREFWAALAPGGAA